MNSEKTMSSSNGHLQIDPQDETKAFREVPPVDYPPFFELSDLGNANRLAEYFGDQIKYWRAMDAWYFWNDAVWVRDQVGIVQRYAKEISDIILQEARFVKSAKEQARYRKWAIKSQHRDRIEAMLALAPPRLHMVGALVDYSPMLLNVQNGMIDLRTSKLLPHDPSCMITRLAVVDYDSEAECPSWLEFLDYIMEGDAERIGDLQRAVGSCLIGMGPIEVVYCYGTNAKMIFLNVIMDMLGDYAQRAPRGILETTQHLHISPENAPLWAARVVVSNASSWNNGSDLELAYDSIGGDTLSAVSMNKNSPAFEPAPTLWILGNQLPNLEWANAASGRRITVVPFNVAILDGGPFGTPIFQFQEEMSGILNWAIEGLKMSYAPANHQRYASASKSSTTE